MLAKIHVELETPVDCGETNAEIDPMVAVWDSVEGKIVAASSAAGCIYLSGRPELEGCEFIVRAASGDNCLKIRI